MKSKITKKTLRNKGELFIMHIMNTHDEMEELLNLTPERQNSRDERLSDKRKKEKLATRLLLREALQNPQAEIEYLPCGRPIVSGSNHQISISHSLDYVAILLHPSLPVGVDIQYLKPNIAQGTELFMQPQELSDTGNTGDIKTLNLYWAAKEATYKYTGGEPATVKDIYVHPFLPGSEGELKATFKNDVIDLGYFYLDNRNFNVVHTH